MAVRPRAWVDDIIGITQGSGNSFANLLLAATVNLDTITVARLIIDLYCTPDGFTTTPSGIQKVEMGVMVVTEAAFDAGAASLPDPRVAADAPARGWLWRGLMLVGYQNPAGTEQDNFNFVGHVAVDIRTMRKVDRGRLVLVTSKTAIQGSELGVDITGLVRTLCLT